jgi:REP element-mobilizing transposase RayT
MPRVENNELASNAENVAKHRDDTGNQKRFGGQSKNLASIIRGYKSSVTMKARQLNPRFAWQANYHDRIIRNEYEYDRIAEYIQNNPMNWGKDKIRK